jgi:hypothetical protein
MTIVIIINVFVLNYISKIQLVKQNIPCKIQPKLQHYIQVYRWHKYDDEWVIYSFLLFICGNLCNSFTAYTENVHHILEEKHPPIYWVFCNTAKWFWIIAVKSLFGCVFQFPQTSCVIQLGSFSKMAPTKRSQVVWSLEIGVAKGHAKQCQRTLAVKQLCLQCG